MFKLKLIIGLIIDEIRWKMEINEFEVEEKLYI